MADSDDGIPPPVPFNKRKTGATGKASKKFSRDTPEYKFLEQLMKKPGAVDPTDRPSDVMARYPGQFGGLTSSQFRSQFNRLKGMYGVATREGKTVAKKRKV